MQTRVNSIQTIQTILTSGQTIQINMNFVQTIRNTDIWLNIRSTLTFEDVF